MNLKTGVTIKLVIIYRNSSTTADEDFIFYYLMKDILTKPHNCIILGDFNQPSIDSHSSIQSPQPKQTNQIRAS